MAAAQQLHREIQSCRTANTNFKLQDIPVGERGPTLLCDTSTGRPRPLVPESWRKQLFDLSHGLSHPSIRATRKLVSTKFVWKGLQKQVSNWSKQCLACQTSKVQTHVKAPLQRFETPLRRFDIHVDLVGALPPSNGYTHLFMVTDRFSRWPEAAPLSSTTATDCAQALLTHWISRFRIPLHISSDQGPQWMSVARLL